MVVEYRAGRKAPAHVSDPARILGPTFVRMARRRSRIYIRQTSKTLRAAGRRSSNRASVHKRLSFFRSRVWQASSREDRSDMSGRTPVRPEREGIQQWV